MTTHAPASGALTKPRARSTRLFYPLTAVLIAILTAIGFGAFYTKGMAYPNRPIAPPIKGLVVAHGLSMTLWVALLVVQTMLISAGRRKLHMTLGKFGALLAVAIFVLGVWLGVASASVAPPGTMIWGLGAKPFMAVPVFSMVLFASFVALGVRARRRPATHRAMMLLATLAALGAAVSRIDALNALYVGTAWEELYGPFLGANVLGVLLLAARSFLQRSLDRPFAIGLAILMIATLAIWQLAKTVLWYEFTASLLG